VHRLIKFALNIRHLVLSPKATLRELSKPRAI